MNWYDTESDIYNLALKNVEACNKQIAKVYLLLQEEIADELKAFYDTVNPNWSEAYQAARLSEIFETVNFRLQKMTGIITERFEAAYLEQYKEIYNNYTYDLSGYYSQYTNGFPILPFSMPDEAAILAGLHKQIGEYSFLDSMDDKQSLLRDSLRENVALSIAKGEGPAALAARLEGTFESGLMRYVTTARTEMLKAYSLAQEESVSQAEDMGIEFTFIWAGRSDGRERESHVALNNTYAKIDGNGNPYFIAGKSRGSGPRLLKGIDSAAQNINCRCRRLNVPIKIDTSQDFPIYTIQKQGTGKDKDEVFNIKLPDFDEYLKMITKSS